MRAQGKLAVGLLTATAVAGLPFLPIEEGTYTVDEARFEVPTPPSSRVEMLARHSTLADLFRSWQVTHLERGGDRAVTVHLGRGRAAASPPRTSGGFRGTVRIDLLGGRVEAEITGLTEPVDLWLVDNRPGSGRSAMPEPGDRTIRLGRLTPPALRWTADLGAGFFDRFELDLVVVTAAGERPSGRSLLYGARTYFERLHTRIRRADATQRPSLLRALTPRALADGLTLRSAHAAAPNPLVTSGLMSQQVADGADLFFRETFDGNGRTCGTCHRVSANHGIDAELIASLPPDDPLFIAERPVEDGGVPGLEIPELLRDFELVLENVDGFADPETRFTLRGVPHIQSLITSLQAPNDDGRSAVERSGWAGDGAPMSGALRFFALGAVRQHLPRSLARVEGVDFRLPTSEELDALEAYMLSVGRVVDPRITIMILEDPRADLGRETFLGRGKCFTCHVNLGAINGFGGNRNFETGIERLAHPARAVRSFPHDGGFGLQARDTDGDGTADTFGDGTFNTPPLVEAADTAPFFHNNQFQSLEDAVAFYDEEEFNASPGGDFVDGIDLTEEEIVAVAAFLRVVNAAFNLEIALQRITAAGLLRNGDFVAVRVGETTEPPLERGPTATGDFLLRLSAIELADAVEVLTGGELHPDAVALLVQATETIEEAVAAQVPRERETALQQVAAEIRDAKERLGRGLAFLLGEGNLAF